MSSKFGKSALLVVLVAAFAVLGAQTASADGERRVFMRFAGDFIQTLEQRDRNVQGQPTGTTSFLGLVRAKARGNLGWADLTAAAKSEGVPPEDSFDERCPYGFVKIVTITDNSLVFTFLDLSLLYGDGDGFVCMNFETGEQYAEVNGQWLGGTGRFRNATGDFSISIDEAVVVNGYAQITAETGTITGTLIR